MPTARLLSASVLLGSLSTLSLSAFRESESGVLASQTLVPRVQCSPQEGLLNDIVTIRLSGPTPGSQVAVVADTVLAGGWRARGTFLVNQPLGAAISFGSQSIWVRPI